MWHVDWHNLAINAYLAILAFAYRWLLRFIVVSRTYIAVPW